MIGRTKISYRLVSTETLSWVAKRLLQYGEVWKIDFHFETYFVSEEAIDLVEVCVDGVPYVDRAYAFRYVLEPGISHLVSDSLPHLDFGDGNILATDTSFSSDRSWFFYDLFTKRTVDCVQSLLKYRSMLGFPLCLHVVFLILLFGDERLNQSVRALVDYFRVCNTSE